MDKKEIENVMEKISAQEPVQIQRALGVLTLGYGLMIAGIIFWSLLFSSGMIYARKISMLSGFAGSCLVGVTLFLYSLGSYYYFIFHNKHLPIHWFVQGVMRTIVQFYYLGSVVLLFLITQLYHPQINIDFLLLYLLLFLPIYIGYMLPRSEKIKNVFGTSLFEEPSR